MELARGRSARRGVWRYLEIVEGKPFTEEQRETLEHNRVIPNPLCGFAYIEVPHIEVLVD